VRAVNDLGARLGIYAGTLVVCFISGLVPFVNAELWLVAVVVALAVPAQLPLIVLLAAIGQIAAKVLLYYGGLGVVALPGQRFQKALVGARDRVASWQKRPHLVLFTSATIGLPPLYLVSLLAGALRYRLRALVTIGLIGRTLRFGVIAAAAYEGWSR
jgi:membrane protein YqaA with SNARE-associated domain